MELCRVYQNWLNLAVSMISPIHIQALIAYRKRHEKLIQREAVTKLPTKFGTFDM